MKEAWMKRKKRQRKTDRKDKKRRNEKRFGEIKKDEGRKNRPLFILYSLTKEWMNERIKKLDEVIAQF